MQPVANFLIVVTGLDLQHALGLHLITEGLWVHAMRTIA